MIEMVLSIPLSPQLREYLFHDSPLMCVKNIQKPPKFLFCCLLYSYKIYLTNPSHRCEHWKIQSTLEIVLSRQIFVCCNEPTARTVTEFLSFHSVANVYNFTFKVRESINLQL